MPECPANVRTSSATAPRLRRVLTLWDLIFYGIVLIQPIAPVPLYGVAEKLSNGHFVTTILIAMFAMMITAFTYVGMGLNPHLGFLIGWAMLLDYILQPLITTIWIATALHARYFPHLPYFIAAAIVVGILMILNLRGVKTSARANKILLAVMCVVIAAFIYLAVRYLFHTQG